jgi:BMFP domain-containing protein YqiC
VQLQEQTADKEAAMAAQRTQKEMLAARIAQLEARLAELEGGR